MDRIKIKSDGTAAGTFVYLDDKPLGNVRFVNFSADADLGCPTVTLELVGMPVELDVHAQVVKSPFAPIELDSEEFWIINKKTGVSVGLKEVAKEDDNG